MAEPAPEIFDENGKILRASSRIGQGGEGSVYELFGDKTLAAKIYTKGLNQERAEKIRTMIALRTGAIEKLTAWPLQLVFNAHKAPIGILLPKIIGGKDVHQLYSPRSRRSEFTRADWRFLIRVGSNISRAFGAVHESCCIIGDVNHGSVLVRQDATVCLIDCDSFQLKYGGKIFRCEVGVETFTPPELQGKSFQEVVRTENSDNFGLAVMLFLLLFMGRHPFAGRFTGKGEMPIAKAIAEFRFAYAADRRTMLMEQPPGTPPLAIVGDELATLFERAFSRNSNTDGRPTPKQWLDALGKLEKKLIQCQVNSSHWHLSTIDCPWCPMEGATGVSLFPFILQQESLAGFTFDAIWTEIQKLPNPGPAPGFPDVTCVPTETAYKAMAAARNLKIGTLMLAVVLGVAAVFGNLPRPFPLVAVFGAVYLFVLGLRRNGRHTGTSAIERRRQDALSHWNVTKREWEEKAGGGSFEAKLRQLTKVQKQWNQLAQVRVQKIDQLKTDHRKLQLDLFLDQYEIEFAKIEGIGPGRKQTLGSFGIETAADIAASAIANVPGFGPKLQTILMTWRQSIESRFAYDSTKPIDPREILRVEQEISAMRSDLQKQLSTGFGELKQIHSQTMAARTHLLTRMAEIHRAWMQAEADWNLIQKA